VIKGGDEAPAVDFFRRLVDEFGQPVMDAQNFDVLHVESSGVPIPDRLMRRVRRIHPARAEHESHASAVHHRFVLCFLLDSEEKLP
jgi:hypothetical protein